MFRQKKFWFLLLLFLFSLGLFVLVVLLVPPDFHFSILSLSLPIFPAFFLLLFIVLFSLGTLVLRTILHGLLLGFFVVTYLLMRLNGLTHPFFLLVLFGIFLAIELLFVGSKHKEQRFKRQD